MVLKPYFFELFFWIQLCCTAVSFCSFPSSLLMINFYKRGFLIQYLPHQIAGERTQSNSYHTNNLFFFALNPIIATKRLCNTTGILFTAVVQRLVWSFPICLRHSNRATMKHHMHWIFLFVYWRIMPVNFLPGSHVSVHPRITCTHGNSNRAGQALLSAPQLFSVWAPESGQLNSCYKQWDPFQRCRGSKPVHSCQHGIKTKLRNL